MKKIRLLLPLLLTTAFGFSQTAVPKAISSGKIILNNGQKIISASNITVDADLSMGMTLNSSYATENVLEVKSNTDKTYNLSSTLTKLKVDFDMMGQAINYDSEKKQEPTSEIEKSFAEKLNKPVDVILDNTTGKATLSQKKENPEGMDTENPVNGMLNVFSESSDDAVVSGAFELIPAGKTIGDNWTDTIKEKDASTIRTYTLKSITGNEALLLLDMTITAKNKMEMQGMEFEFKSTTKTTGEITTDTQTGQVKNKTTKSKITGSIQMMGQDVPISATVNSTATYK